MRTMKWQCLMSFGLVMVLTSPGCAQFDLRRDIPWRMGQISSPKAPTKLVAVWTDAVLHQGGKPATRGFGGRLMFYGAEENAPIKVEGTLIVYAFDEADRSPTDVKPDRKYVFPPSQFAQHYSKSKLGHSYSVWIPWDEVGGPRKEISLIARFIPKQGAAIVSAQARQILPGLPPNPDPAYSSAQPMASPPGQRTYPSTLGGSPMAPASAVSGLAKGPAQNPATRFAHQPGIQPAMPTSENMPSPTGGISLPNGLQPPAMNGVDIQQASNPLRQTNFEEAPPSETYPPGASQNNTSSENRTRLKTTTIPVPAQWLRSHPSTQGTVAPAGNTFSTGGVGPQTQAAPSTWSSAPATVPSRVGLPSEGVPANLPNGIVTGSAARGSNGSGQNFPSYGPSTRFAPIGPQARGESIAPRARDRAALPLLPGGSPSPPPGTLESVRGSESAYFGQSSP